MWPIRVMTRSEPNQPQLTSVPDAARKPVSKAIKTTCFPDSSFERALRPGMSSPFSILRIAQVLLSTLHSQLTWDFQQMLQLYLLKWGGTGWALVVVLHPSHDRNPVNSRRGHLLPALLYMPPGDKLDLLFDELLLGWTAIFELQPRSSKIKRCVVI